MARTYEFIVGEAEAGLRLDLYLVRRLPSTVSRSMIQQAIRQGAVKIGDHLVKANRRLHSSDVIIARFDLPAPRRSTFWVYVLRCRDGTFYVGQTDDLRRRFEEHQQGEISWTKSRLPVELIHYEGRSTREEAVRREQKLQTGYGRAWLKRQYQAGKLVARQAGQLPARSTNATLVPQAIPLEIVYEDAALLVVNKPPGLVTHPAPGHWNGTLVNAILWHLETGHGTRDTGHGTPDASPVPRHTSQISRAGIVHRLDKDTSGLLLVAKTAEAHTVLSRQLKIRAMKRRYLALAEGHLPFDAGTIDAPLGRHQLHRKEMTVRHLGGRSAVTHYRVLARSLLGHETRDTGHNTIDVSHVPRSASRDLRYTVLDISLETGRTHQIRVHLAHLGHPVLGDLTYGKRGAEFWHDLGISRQLLHAYAMRFTHPVTRQPVELTGSIPEDITRWVAADIERKLRSDKVTEVQA